MCGKALVQERYNYRHDSILNYMLHVLELALRDDIELFVDIPGHTNNGGTIPCDIVPTAERPDIVIIDRSVKKIVLGELTASFEPNMMGARKRKVEKYAQLVADIRDQGYICELVCFEVGSRGLITKENQGNISRIMRTACQSVQIRLYVYVYVYLYVNL